MTGTKSPRNDFVLVSCKHDANFDIRAGLTSSRSHVNGALVCGIHEWKALERV